MERQDNKYFVKQLSEEQREKLVRLCLKWNGHVEATDKVTILLPPAEEWDKVDTIMLHAYVEQHFRRCETYYLNDFSMRGNALMASEVPEANFDYLLHAYLTNIFGDEYLNSLMNKRIQDACAERASVQSFAESTEFSLLNHNSVASRRLIRPNDQEV